MSENIPSMPFDIPELSGESDDAAASAAENEDIPELSQANYVGQGFDVFKALDEKSLIAPLFDFDSAAKKRFKLLGQYYMIPSVLNPIENPKGYDIEATCESREEFQNKIAMQANVTASYGAFSGEWEAKYQKHTSTTVNMVYAFRKTYIPIAFLQLIDERALQYISPKFRNSINALPATVSEATLQSFAQFFKDYGVYYTQKIVLGGVVEFYMSMKNSQQWSKETIKAKWNTEYSGALFEGSIDASISTSEEWKRYTSERSASINASGGDPAKVAALTKIDPSKPTKATADAYTGWVSSIERAPGIVDYELKGIWNLCGDKSRVVEQAWQLYGSRMRPQLSIETWSASEDQDAEKRPQQTDSRGCASCGSRQSDYSIYSPVRKLEVWWDGDKVRGIGWTHWDGTQKAYGNTSGSKAAYEFQPGETLKSCRLQQTNFGYGSVYGISIQTTRGSFTGGNMAPEKNPYSGPPFYLPDSKYEEILRAATTDLNVEGRTLMGFFGTVNSDNFMNAIGLWVSPPVSGWTHAPEPKPPVIIVAGRQLKADDQPDGACGYHVLVLNGRVPSEPSAILFNRIYTLPKEPAFLYSFHHAEMYKNIVRDIQGTAFEDPNNLLVLASFGMDYSLAPTDDCYGLLRTAGAGDQLTQWRQSASTRPNVHKACNYMLIGYFRSNPGTGIESFVEGKTAQLGAHLFPKALKGEFALSAAG